MKRNFLTCAGSLVLILVVAIIGSIAGVNLLRDSFKTSVLQELGFKSQAEYDEFATNLNASFDETTFYQHTYTDADKASVKQKLLNSITLADGAPLFLENGYIDINALEKDNNASITTALELTNKEYSYFAQLLLTSIYHSNEKDNAVLENFQIISLVVNADGTHTIVMKLSTASIKKSMKSYGASLPNSLFLKVNYSLTKTANSSEVQSCTLSTEFLSTDFSNCKNGATFVAGAENSEHTVANATMQINELNETYNAKCNTFLNKVFDVQNSAVEFAKIFISLSNAFDTVVSSTTTFATDVIRVAP